MSGFYVISQSIHNPELTRWIFQQGLDNNVNFEQFLISCMKNDKPVTVKQEHVDESDSSVNDPVDALITKYMNDNLQVTNDPKDMFDVRTFITRFTRAGLESPQPLKKIGLQEYTRRLKRLVPNGIVYKRSEELVYTSQKKLENDIDTIVFPPDTLFNSETNQYQFKVVGHFCCMRFKDGPTLTPDTKVRPSKRPRATSDEQQEQTESKDDTKDDITELLGLDAPPPKRPYTGGKRLPASLTSTLGGNDDEGSSSEDEEEQDATTQLGL